MKQTLVSNSFPAYLLQIYQVTSSWQESNCGAKVSRSQCSSLCHDPSHKWLPHLTSVTLPRSSKLHSSFKNTLLNRWSTPKPGLPALPWHSPRTTLPFLVCQPGSGGWRTVQRSSCLWGLVCPVVVVLQFGVPWWHPDGSSASLHGKVVICQATVAAMLLYSKGPCDLWCYKNWKIPSLPFIYNWKHNNWLQCQLQKAGSTLGKTHTCLRTPSHTQPPASQAVLRDFS